MFKSERYLSKNEGKHNFFGKWEDTLDELQTMDHESKKETSLYYDENFQTYKTDSEQNP